MTSSQLQICSTMQPVIFTMHWCVLSHDSWSFSHYSPTLNIVDLMKFSWETVHVRILLSQSTLNSPLTPTFFTLTKFYVFPPVIVTWYLLQSFMCLHACSPLFLLCLITTMTYFFRIFPLCLQLFKKTLHCIFCKHVSTTQSNNVDFINILLIEIMIGPYF